MGIDELIESSKDYSLGMVSSKEVDLDELTLSYFAWKRLFAGHPFIAEVLAQEQDTEGKKEVIKHIDSLIQNRVDGIDVGEEKANNLESVRERIIEEITGK
jgi:hypothetical protein